MFFRSNFLSQKHSFIRRTPQANVKNLRNENAKNSLVFILCDSFRLGFSVFVSWVDFINSKCVKNWKWNKTTTKMEFYWWQNICHKSHRFSVHDKPDVHKGRQNEKQKHTIKVNCVAKHRQHKKQKLLLFHFSPVCFCLSLCACIFVCHSLRVSGRPFFAEMCISLMCWHRKTPEHLDAIWACKRPWHDETIRCINEPLGKLSALRNYKVVSLAFEKAATAHGEFVCAFPKRVLLGRSNECARECDAQIWQS